MKETRKISMYNIRNECIKNNWYTKGDCDDYDNILTFANDLENATTDDLETIATDIKTHSETDYEIESIMFVLANDCCTTFIED